MTNQYRIDESNEYTCIIQDRCSENGKLDRSEFQHCKFVPELFGKQ